MAESKRESKTGSDILTCPITSGKFQEITIIDESVFAIRALRLIPLSMSDMRRAIINKVFSPYIAPELIYSKLILMLDVHMPDVKSIESAEPWMRQMFAMVRCWYTARDPAVDDHIHPEDVQKEIDDATFKEAHVLLFVKRLNGYLKSDPHVLYSKYNVLSWVKDGVYIR